ncbi:MAG: class I SAM-dependent methyltransferase, partial [Candidatus Methylomirabilales bacterium]
MTARCPACDRPDLVPFHAQDGVPAHSCLLLEDRQVAREFPRGAIRLAYCRACGFITNTAFDTSLNQYSTRYEETQGFSPRFQDFARGLAQRWVDRYDLRGTHIIEIGCGKGEFLGLMCELGKNQGTGIDPSAVPGRAGNTAEGNLRFVLELYSDGYGPLDAGAIVCRHTLEHISPVADFMRTVRWGIGDRLDTVVLFELPDVLRVLREVAFWDVYYEHCSYFTAGSLARLFHSTGFEILDLSLEYDDQYIVVEARPVGASRPERPFLPEADLGEIAHAVEHFQSSYAATLGRWRKDLRRAVDRGQRVVVWGSGSKGVAYLTSLGLETEVEYVVDINPFKHGMHMAGTGHPIIGPDALVDYRPD